MSTASRGLRRLLRTHEQAGAAGRHLEDQAFRRVRRRARRQDPVIEEAELARLGFAAAIHPGAALRPAAAAVSEGFTTIGGEPAVSSDAGPAALFDLVGLPEWADLGRRYDQGRTRSWTA